VWSALEELELPFAVWAVDVTTLEEKQPAFLAINPNGSIPAIVDRKANLTIFESGAILGLPRQMTGASCPQICGTASRSSNWLLWLMGGLGPMQGQCLQPLFRGNPANRDQQSSNETRRLYGVMDTQLRDHEFLADNYSIADIVCWPWFDQHEWAGVALGQFPSLKRWRSAVARLRFRPETGAPSFRRPEP
jgi:glutathione S-transferase